MDSSSNSSESLSPIKDDLSPRSYEPDDINQNLFFNYNQPAIDLSWILSGIDLNNIGNPYENIPRNNHHSRRRRGPINYLENKPWGLTSNPNKDHIYMADRVANLVKIHGADGREIGTFGRKSESNFLNGFNRPTGIAFDAVHNRVVVTDKDNHRISLFSPEGEFIYTFGSKGYQDGLMNYPWGVSVSPDGKKIAVADSRNHRVQVFDDYGNFLAKYSEFEKNPFEYKKIFDYPRGIAFDNLGKNLYVTDLNIHIVLKLDEKLENKVLFAEDLNFNRPQGIKVTETGEVIVCNSRNNLVQFIDTEGKLTSRLITNVECPIDITTINRGQNIAVVNAAGILKIY